MALLRFIEVGQVGSEDFTDKWGVKGCVKPAKGSLRKKKENKKFALFPKEGGGQPQSLNFFYLIFDKARNYDFKAGDTNNSFNAAVFEI